MATNQRDRKSNFSVAETNLLSERATEELDLIRGQLSNQVSNRKKNEFWQKLTNDINALGVACRTQQEIKNKWRNMTRSAKKKVTNNKKIQKGTGGGPPAPPLTISEERIACAMRNTSAFNGVPGGMETLIDDDTDIARCWREAIDRVIEPGSTAACSSDSEMASVPHQTQGFLSALAESQTCSYLTSEGADRSPINSLVSETRPNEAAAQEICLPPRNRSQDHSDRQGMNEDVLTTNSSDITVSQIPEETLLNEGSQSKVSRKRKNVTSQDILNLQYEVLQKEKFKLDLQIKLLQNLQTIDPSTQLTAEYLFSTLS